MKPRPLVRTLAAALAAVALATAALAQAGYYPLAKGQRWVYANGQTQQFTGTKTVGGQSVSVLSYSIGGKPSSEDYLQATAKGVLLLGSRAGASLTWYTPPLVLYPAGPLAVGARWSSTGRTAAGTVALTSRVVSTEGVATGAGRFNAFVIRTSVTTSSGATSVQDSYFVPSVGTVRFVTGSGAAVDLVGR